MKKQDIEFLTELQRELLDQETDGNAPPVFWGVMTKTTVYGMAEDYRDNLVAFIDGEEYNDLDEMKKELVALKNSNIDYEALDKCSSFAEARAALSGNNLVTFSGVRYVDKLSEDTGCFLTKRAVKQHIENYSYNYNQPRSYAMTAARNPEFEHVLKILQETDWSKMPVDKE